MNHTIWCSIIIILTRHICTHPLHITSNFIRPWLINFISSLIKSIQLILPFHLRLYLPSIVSSAGDFLPINCHHLDERRDYRRLLVQLEETERRFDEFWNSHLTRLKQCLDLRRFEQDFRELQVRVASCVCVCRNFLKWTLFVYVSV